MQSAAAPTRYHPPSPDLQRQGAEAEASRLPNRHWLWRRIASALVLNPSQPKGSSGTWGSEAQVQPPQQGGRRAAGTAEPASCAGAQPPTVLFVGYQHNWQLGSADRAVIAGHNTRHWKHASQFSDPKLAPQQLLKKISMHHQGSHWRINMDSHNDS